TLRSTLDDDRTKTFTAEISKLGLVEMTRQNVTEGVREIISRPCPTCDGDGVIKSEETIAIEFERRLRVIAKKALKKHEAFLVQMNPRVSAQFTGNGKRVLHALEEQTGRRFHFQGSEGLPLDHFDILMEGSREEVQERAVPFREGDEVLVHIVEPHMYDVDDAVAKIDGYIISVSGGGRHVGDKRLVRIEHAGRTSATAVLLDQAEPVEPVEDAPADSPEDDDVESSPRRRGRRGGRRRKVAAETGAPGEPSSAAPSES
ncbi:MAG: ribonuclease, partial [Solirubrobacteraceae bacterium]|nr:ribonuclease [Solirubrobacteraceae bacterium]